LILKLLVFDKTSILPTMPILKGEVVSFLKTPFKNI